MGGIVTAIANLCSAVGACFNFLTKRSELKNTAAMQANQVAQQEAGVRDQAAQAVAKQDLKTSRDLLAE